MTRSMPIMLMAIGAASVAILTIAVVPQAVAANGGSQYCSTNYHVYTQSKSAGYTGHTHYNGGGSYGWQWSSVSPSNPYRTFHSEFFQSIDSWSVCADVLEWATVGCASNPV